MKRTPMKRGTMLGRMPMNRSTKPIAPVSATKKRRREQRAGMSMAELRPILWKRCGGHCERCVRTLDFETFDAHHRKFRSRGGKDEIVNLVALCGECHFWAHSKGREAGPAGFAVLASQDPGTIPITLPGNHRVLLTKLGGYHLIRKEGS